MATIVLIGTCFLGLATTQIIKAWTININIPLTLALIFAGLVLGGYALVTGLLLKPTDYSDN